MSNSHLSQSEKDSGKPKNDLVSLRITKTILRTLLIGRKLLIRDKFDVVTTEEDMNECQKLLYTEYLKRSLCEKNDSKIYVNAHTLVNTATTLITKRNNKITGTLAVMEDSECGLPADTLYKEELDELRAKGIVPIEVGSLALDNSRFSKKAHSLKSIKKFSVLATLFTGMVNYIYQFTRATHLVIMVNPKHVSIYDFFGFTQFAEIRHYPHVNKPAVPMILSIERFLSSSDVNPAAFYAISNLNLLKKKKKFQYSANSISKFILKLPKYFANLSKNQERALLEEFPQLETIYTVNKLNAYSPTLKAGSGSIIEQAELN